MEFCQQKWVRKGTVRHWHPRRRKRRRNKKQTLELEEDTEVVIYVPWATARSSMTRVQVALHHGGNECDTPLLTSVPVNGITVVIVIITTIIILNTHLQVKLRSPDSQHTAD